MSDIRAFQTCVRPQPGVVRLMATAMAVGLHAAGLAALVWQQRPPAITAPDDTATIHVSLYAAASLASPTAPLRDMVRPSTAEPKPEGTAARSVAPVLSHRTVTPTLAPAALVVGLPTAAPAAAALGDARAGGLHAPHPGPGMTLPASAQMRANLGPKSVDPYPAQVLAWVERHKRYPALASKRSLGGVTVVAVTLDRRGRVMRLQLAQSSGHALLDDAALDVFRRAEPFPRPAGTAGWSRRQFEIPIEFRPAQGSG